jgi:colicin import membrane protein
MIAPTLLDARNRDSGSTAHAVTWPLQGGVRIAKFAFLLALSLGAAACGPSAAEQKAKLDEVQKKADDHYATMEKQYKDQVATAQKSAEECQQKLNDASTQAKAEAQKEAEDEVNKAHAEADKLAAEAAKALAKARTAYTESERRDYAALVKQVQELQTKAAKAPAKTKPQIDKAMKDLVTKRDAAAKEIPEINKATLETLRTAKAKVDQKMAVLKQAIAALRAKLA